MLTADAIATLKLFMIGKRTMGARLELLDDGNQYLTDAAAVNAAALSADERVGLCFVSNADRTMDALDAFLWAAVPGLQPVQEYVREHGGTEQSAPYRM
tara:strand:+ start:239 stop:535 length:297 start_codon:yes stop_codon:yes gene_type:complete